LHFSLPSTTTARRPSEGPGQTIEEFALDRWDPTHLLSFLHTLRALAHNAVAGKRSLLMWMSL
jgi:hypothetical protein